MFSDLLKSIKGTRRLSYNHWRYRLLHWIFGVRNPSCSGLPRFLYTHYCPLFHLTNILVICLMLIIPLKIVLLLLWLMFKIPKLLIVAVCWVLEFVDEAIGFIVKAIASRLPKKAVVNSVPEPVEKENELAKEDKAALLEMEKQRYILLVIRGGCSHSVEQFKYITPEIVKELTEAHQLELKREKEESLKKREEEKAYQQLLAARLAFWVNFSRVFFKCGLNIFYVSLIGGMSYGLYNWGIPVLTEIAQVCHAVIEYWRSVNWTNVAYYSGISVLTSVSIVGFIIFCMSLPDIYKNPGVKHVVKLPFNLIIGVFRTIRGICQYLGVKYVFAIPFVFLSGITGVCSRFTVNCVHGMATFVVMFYEDNCPPVVIVDENDQEVQVT